MIPNIVRADIPGDDDEGEGWMDSSELGSESVMIPGVCSK
jgi:hypothetical protein